MLATPTILMLLYLLMPLLAQGTAPAGAGL